MARYWTRTRDDLDHDLADVAAIPLLLGMVCAREEVIADLQDTVEALHAELLDRDADTAGHEQTTPEQQAVMGDSIIAAGLDTTAPAPAVLEPAATAEADGEPPSPEVTL